MLTGNLTTDFCSVTGLSTDKTTNQINSEEEGCVLAQGSRGFHSYLLSPRHWSSGVWQKPPPHSAQETQNGRWTRNQVSPSKAHSCDLLQSYVPNPKVSMTSWNNGTGRESASPVWTCHTQTTACYFKDTRASLGNLCFYIRTS